MVADGGSGSGCLTRPTIPLPAVGGVSACMVIIMDHGIMVFADVLFPGIARTHSVVACRGVEYVVLLDGRRRTTSIRIRPPASSWFMVGHSALCAVLAT